MLHVLLLFSTITIASSLLVSHRWTGGPAGTCLRCLPGPQPGTTPSPLFKVNPALPVQADELENGNLIHIVTQEASDLQCNQLLWKCLGYTYHPSTASYTNEHVLEEWKVKYPSPVDYIGMTREYGPETGQLPCFLLCVSVPSCAAPVHLLCLLLVLAVLQPPLPLLPLVRLTDLCSHRQARPHCSDPPDSLDTK